MAEVNLFEKLDKSTVAVGGVTNDKKLIPTGTGFIISADPLRVLTCFHTTQPESSFSKLVIVKRTAGQEIDLREAEVNYIFASGVIRNPNLDTSILELDPSISKNTELLEKMGLLPITPFELDFGKRNIGSPVSWLGMAVLKDLTVTPRFFKGIIVSSYKNDSNYTYPTDLSGGQALHKAEGLHILEIDQLFIPGCSGGPVVKDSGKIVGFIHGYGSWPIGTSPSRITLKAAKIKDSNETQEVDIETNPPIVATLSRAIDIRSLENYLKENSFI